MEEIAKYSHGPLGLQYLPHTRIILCSACRVTVGRAAVEGHLHRKHGEKIGKEFRDEMTKWIASLPQQPLTDLEMEELSKTHTTYIPELPIEDGYKCQGCGLAFKNLKNIKRCANRHNPPSSYIPCKIQIIFSVGARHTYFPVDNPPNPTFQPSEACVDMQESPTSPSSALAAFFQTEKDSVNKYHPTCAITPEDQTESREKLLKGDLWLKRCGFTSELSPAFIQNYKHLISSNMTRSSALDFITEMVQTYLCSAASLIKKTPHCHLRELCSARADTTKGAPFDIPQNSETYNRYLRAWAGLIEFVVLAHRAELELEYPEDVQPSIHSLATATPKTPQSSIQDWISTISYALVTQRYNRRRTCPVFVFNALKSYNYEKYKLSNSVLQFQIQ